MSVNRASMIIGLVRTVIKKWFGRCYILPTCCQPFSANNIGTLSLPHAGNEVRLSVKDFWLSILGNLSGDWLNTPINEILAAFGGKKNRDKLPAPSSKWASTERQQYLVLHLCNVTGDWLHKSITQVVAACRERNNSDMRPTPSWKWASTEGQQFLVVHPGYPNGRLVANIHKWCIGRL